MSIKLLLLDLDDTLFGKDLRISPANREALAAAERAGVLITLASGRMFRSMRPYAEELGLRGPQIAYNGALARPLSGPDIWHEPVPNEAARSILAELGDRDLTVQIYLDDTLYVAEINDWVRLYTDNAKVEAVPVGDLLGFMDGRAPTKILALGRPELVAELRESFAASWAGRAEFTTSKPSYLEITAPGVSKAVALSRLAAHYGLDRAETMAIGDGLNDLGMLEAAGIGVAVGNAPEDVKRRVGYVVAPCHEDGVAEAVGRFVLGGERGWGMGDGGW